MNWQQAVEQVQRSRVTFFGIASRHAGPNDHAHVIDASAEVSGGEVDPVLTDSEIPMALTRIASDLLGQYAGDLRRGRGPTERVATARRSQTTRRYRPRTGTCGRALTLVRPAVPPCSIPTPRAGRPDPSRQMGMS